MTMDRRKFIRVSSLTALAGALAIPGSKAQEEIVAGDNATPPTTPAPPKPEGLPQERPLTAKRWAMVIDMKKCREQKDCTRCVDACHVTHNVPQFDNPKDEVKWIWKESFEHAFHEQEHEHLNHEVREAPVLLLCNHCDNPPCVKVCPTQATWKREEDGIVMMDWHRCIGCRYCMAACPYGSRSFNWRDPRPRIAEIQTGFPTRTRGVVEKCTFCETRLAEGKIPACVEACEAGALVFGDLEDPHSEVRRLLEENFSLRRKPGLGTEPEIYYLMV